MQVIGEFNVPSPPTQRHQSKLFTRLQVGVGVGGVGNLWWKGVIRICGVGKGLFLSVWEVHPVQPVGWGKLGSTGLWGKVGVGVRGHVPPGNSIGPWSFSVPVLVPGNLITNNWNTWGILGDPTQSQCNNLPIGWGIWTAMGWGSVQAKSVFTCGVGVHVPPTCPKGGDPDPVLSGVGAGVGNCNWSGVGVGFKLWVGGGWGMVGVRPPGIHPPTCGVEELGSGKGVRN